MLVNAGGRCDGAMVGVATGGGGCACTAGDRVGSVTGGDVGGEGRAEVFFQFSSNKAYVDELFI